MSIATISTHERGSTLSALARESFDLIVIGGGITGAGIARDAARRGLSVALLEAADFASGTSSRSSKLIHGGLRYLERGEINLVRKTALERKEIYKAAPHLCEPRWMVMPMSGRTKLYSLRIAVTTYERLGAVDRKDGHRAWSGSTLAEKEPVLDRRKFPHALAYREYLTDDARLVLANLRSAAAAGATLINHAPVVGLLRSGDRAIGVEARCELSGELLSVQGRMIVNAAGPWVEAIQRLENPAASPLLHLSKGIHISIPASKLPVRNLLVLDTSDKRRIFAIRRGDVVYIGTTDTTYEPGAEVWPTIEREDVDYLLAPVSDYFSCGPLGPGDIVGAWAGLRPLIADPTKKNPAELSRRDELLLGPLGILSVAGGKLTGYRGMARRVLDSVAEGLGRALPEPGDEPPLPGGDFDGDLKALASHLGQTHDLDEPTAGRLARLFGTEAEQVLALGAQPLYPGATCVEGEVPWAVAREGAAKLEDLLYRRTRLPLYGLDPRAAIAPLAARMASELAWDDERQRAEIAHAQARLDADLGFT
ncbi:Aerobic glycerol-3-phosphate dehydrogenase [Enhygromyxa salina]|uniref:Glycerol-3-phosphate dehydrogenase n=1 Tax=Enhygromyxa salina TaxID=215803 RepID=A0A2S9YIU8_9BACT|nr:glycerol-3-phosphate dehydrogenase/oxidase [Enhygromyxa salina]PRQ05033.1 Aerobic glycerol-3-phosphate dehydrogenase [Enhygromyxa salina]